MHSFSRDDVIIFPQKLSKCVTLNLLLFNALSVHLPGQHWEAQLIFC